MYAACIWCNQALGRNETIEQFPVGRRLAFDQAAGRLWVVCPNCERWNLSPLEERWEAIEACEKLYRDTRKRVSTDNIGLARVGEGVDLVRIGKPMLPEFAGWRYGDQFGRRYRKAMMIGAAMVAGTGLAIAGQIALGIGGVGLLNLGSLYEGYRNKKTVNRLTRPNGSKIDLSALNAGKTRVQVEGDGLTLAVRGTGDEWANVSAEVDVIDALRRDGASRRRINSAMELKQWHLLEGEEARQALSAILPIVNRDGASKSVVESSVRLVERRLVADYPFPLRLTKATEQHTPLREMEPNRRLAAEIMLHEAEERRWLEGELRDLEARWKEADEIAGIADSLTLPAGIEERLESLRKR
ncbi:MAG: hypothetical protein SFW08_06720 [Gemmatimonadaceae bacterium]|nr:hypothetical protein [Gemmatimonadaceae bacterium]